MRLFIKNFGPLYTEFDAIREFDNRGIQVDSWSGFQGVNLEGAISKIRQDHTSDTPLVAVQYWTEDLRKGTVIGGYMEEDEAVELAESFR